MLTLKTKLRLLVSAGVPSTEISVDAVDGMVTLYGKIDTENERRNADAEASRTGRTIDFSAFWNATEKK